jgi:CRP-like cAMP-binding protein
MHEKDDLAAFRDNYLFEELTEQQLGQVLSISRETSASKDTYIIHEGEIDEDVYLIVSGKVGVIKKDPLSGEAHQIATLGSGELIGEMAVIDTAPRSASIMALEDSHFLVIPLSELNSLAAHIPTYQQIVQNISKRLTHRLRLTSEYTVQALQTELAGEKLRAEMGKFLFMMLVILSSWIFLVSWMSSLASALRNTSVISFSLLALMLAAGYVYVNKSSYSLRFYGLTLINWKKNALEGIVFSLPILLFGVIAKWLLIHFVSSLKQDKLFQLDFHSPTGLFLQILPGLLYICVTPVQEFLARGCLQSSIYVFLKSPRALLLSIILSNIIFASLHVFISMTYAIFAWMCGCFWGWLYARQKSLVGCVLSHMLIGGVFIFALDFGTIFRKISLFLLF